MDVKGRCFGQPNGIPPMGPDSAGRSSDNRGRLIPTLKIGVSEVSGTRAHSKASLSIPGEIAAGAGGIAGPPDLASDLSTFSAKWPLRPHPRPFRRGASSRR